jgi:hypothetical protein
MVERDHEGEGETGGANRGRGCCVGHVASEGPHGDAHCLCGGLSFPSVTSTFPDPFAVDLGLSHTLGPTTGFL